jgi:hypothetical protein
MVFRNVGMLEQYYTASQHRGPRHEQATWLLSPFILISFDIIYYYVNLQTIHYIFTTFSELFTPSSILLEPHQSFEIPTLTHVNFCCHGLVHMVCSDTEWTSETMNPFRHFSSTPWTAHRPIARLQLHGTAEHRRRRISTRVRSRCERENPCHAARMREVRNAYTVLVEKPEGKRPLGRPSHRWENNTRAVWKVRGLAAMRPCYAEGA